MGAPLVLFWVIFVKICGRFRVFFEFFNLMDSGWAGFSNVFGLGLAKNKNRQAKGILLCFRLPVDWYVSRKP